MAATELAFNTTKELKRDPSQSEQDLQFETLDQDGRKVTVLRDAGGSLVYPSYVPPQVEEPGAGSHRQETSEPRGPSLGKPPRKIKSDPVEKAEDGRKSPLPQPRPSNDKRSASEAAPKQGIRRFTTVPMTLRRAGTNASDLQKALRREEAHDWSSSSSSEDEGPGSDSDDAGQQQKKKKGKEKDAEKRAKPQNVKRPSDDQYRRFKVGNQNYQTKGKVSKRDGRLNISVNDTSSTGYLAKAIGSAVKRVVPRDLAEKVGDVKDGDVQRVDSGKMGLPSVEDMPPCPKLNIVIMVIGSRGDIQPFLRIGQILKEQYGHRVRIASHPAFREFVEDDSGLEFFSVGGDPSELMAFMVKNPGMIPTLETVRAGDIGRRRAAMAEMFQGFWHACIDSTDDRSDAPNMRLVGNKDPFVADAIIANPPSFAHYHIAEALGIPLHLMFTFPYTPTQDFPHPLASIKKSNVDTGYTNFISYPLVEMMVWQGLGDLVNDLRVKTLGLDPVSTLWAPGATYRLHVPFTYLWSPGFVPKPEDWGDEIDIAGYVFMDLGSSYKPPADLQEFLDAGEPPVYIGFGSIVVDDADKFTEMIFEAIKLAGVRALVSKGWGGLGGEGDSVPEGIYMLDNTPHDWLFPRVSCTVIHGGAGTVAISLKCGKPTMVVTYFGDQVHNGEAVKNQGAGPPPVPYKHLTAEKLAEGIKFCLGEEAQAAAAKIARVIERDGDGAANACRSFHKHLTLRGPRSMRCSIMEDRVATWHVKNTNLRLSAVAADVVVGKGFVPWRKLRLIRHKEWNDFEGPGEPVTGLAGTLVTSVADVLGGVGGVPYRLSKSSHQRRERKERRKKRQEARNQKTQKPQGDPKVPNGKTTQGSSSPKSQQQRDSDTRSMLTADTAGEETTRAGEFVTNVGKGVGKSAHALVKTPVDLSVALAQGFHNAPRLYGDDTVRRPHRVTGMRSGLRAARIEFALGIYDGFTGVVRLPIRGARDGGGVKGFTKGVGMGLTGFLLKDFAALAGLFAYPLKGVAKELEKGRTPVLRHIRRARIVQAQRELGSLDRDARQQLERHIVEGWGVLHELADEIDAAEKRRRKGGLGFGRLRSKISVRRRRGLGAAFESVDTARQALDAVRRGELEAVVEMGVQRQEEGKGKIEKKVKTDRLQEASENAGEKRKEDQQRKSRDSQERASTDRPGSDGQKPNKVEANGNTKQQDHHEGTRDKDARTDRSEAADKSPSDAHVLRKSTTLPTENGTASTAH